MQDLMLFAGTLATKEQRTDVELGRRHGLSHQNYLTPNPVSGGVKPLVSVLANVGTPLKEVVAKITHPVEQEIVLAPQKVEWNLIEWQYAQWWSAEFPSFDNGTLVRYTITATTAQDEVIHADDGLEFAYYVADHTPPAWAEDAIIYQIFPDRFNKGGEWGEQEDLNAIHGGTLAGIIAKMSYVADLGFNAIWLNPFFPDHTHHGYHASDYLSVNPRLGTLDDLIALRDSAKEHGIRLILDFVGNHWGDGHPTFIEAKANPDSPYVAWYNWKEYPHSYESFFGVKGLPQLNVDHPPARQHLIDAVLHWLDFGFSGLRCDYAVGPTHSFWADLRYQVKAKHPDAWIFAEAVEDPASQISYLGRFDGILDFMLAYALRGTFAKNEMSLSAFDAFLTQHEQYFPAAFTRTTFLDNHDMDRFLHLSGNDKAKLKLAATVLFTLSGSPIIYYGTETGLTQQVSIRDVESDGMAEARTPMRWDKIDGELHAFFRDLISLRKAHPALVSGNRKTVWVNDQTETYAYTRSTMEEAALIALNRGQQAQSILVLDQKIELPAQSAQILFMKQ